jgi:hypothetical protein
MATSNSLQFYLDRAEQARNEATAATLSHVRERCRRAEAAWAALAEKAARNQEGRLQEIQMKAAREAAVNDK